MRYHVQTAWGTGKWVVRRTGQEEPELEPMYTRCAAVALARKIARSDGEPESRVYVHRKDGTVEKVIP